MSPFGGTRTEDGLEVHLPRANQAPALGREAIEGLRKALDADVFEDLRLLVSELVSNSVRHVGEDPSSWVRLRLDVTPRVVRAEVSDPGPGFGPALPPSRPGPESGWGLYLVGALAERWGIQSTPTATVWFELAREPRRSDRFQSSRA